MDRKTHGAILAAAITLTPLVALANGYNHISDIAIPALIIAFAVAYAALAHIPALLVFLVLRLSTRMRGRYWLTFLGAFIGGEAGIGLDVLLAWYFLDTSGWTSYHYTLYPWVILGMAIALAAAGYLLKARKEED